MVYGATNTCESHSVDGDKALTPHEELAYKFFSSRSNSSELCTVDRLWPTAQQADFGGDSVIISDHIFMVARPTHSRVENAMARAQGIIQERSMMSYGNCAPNATLRVTLNKLVITVDTVSKMSGWDVDESYRLDVPNQVASYRPSDDVIAPHRPSAAP